ncbi:MAG: nucleotidyltransferase domain-containing protein [Deltaproteobacteria bacterium]|nr:nucleotidyltransferase domain-containing protein [Deltaproteobacteria bacterium]
MKEIIIKELEKIEKEFHVRIIYACESGSRAWGFPSMDSDYDVRFIYVHPRDWYLSIGERRDVIERPIDSELDIGGWDIRKALKLLKKSNSPLLEWISSPIVYRQIGSVMAPFRDLSEKAFLPESSFHHYLAMAKKKVSEMQEEEKVRAKTAFYALRPLLCCTWIVEFGTQPPMKIDELLSVFIPHGDLRDYLDELIDEKSRNTESFLIEPCTELDDYLELQLSELQLNVPKNPEKLKTEVFDEVFRDVLRTVEE